VSLQTRKASNGGSVKEEQDKAIDVGATMVVAPEEEEEEEEEEDNEKDDFPLFVLILIRLKSHTYKME